MTYYDSDQVEGILTGNTASTTYDSLIAQEGPKADKDVENDLYAYANATPPFTGGDITVDIINAANTRTAARIQLMRGQLEIKKALDDEYDNIIKRLIKRFKTTPTAAAYGPIAVAGSWASAIITEEADDPDFA